MPTETDQDLTPPEIDETPGDQENAQEETPPEELAPVVIVIPPDETPEPSKELDEWKTQLLQTITDQANLIQTMNQTITEMQAANLESLNRVAAMAENLATLQQELSTMKASKAGTEKAVSVQPAEPQQPENPEQPPAMNPETPEQQAVENLVTKASKVWI